MDGKVQPATHLCFGGDLVCTRGLDFSGSGSTLLPWEQCCKFGRCQPTYVVATSDLYLVFVVSRET